MPLVAHKSLPTFERLASEGETILTDSQAKKQDIRELHIGLLNMMPDAAITATERQFFRLIGESNQIAQFYVHPFTLPEIKRNEASRKHIDKYYESFSEIKKNGLDALIITGANVTQPDLAQEPFWEPLIEIIDWAYENVASTLCSCLATHAVMQFRYKQKRHKMRDKRWGVYQHKVIDRTHPLVNGVNTRFDVPHSRYNEVTTQQFRDAGLHVLVESEAAGPHLVVSEDQFRIVFFQGHPEYDMISLLKEYKREIQRYANKERNDYPPFPENYFDTVTQAILNEHKEKAIRAVKSGQSLPEFPEALVESKLDNTWHDSAEAVLNNWIGKVYQTTSNNRNEQYMSHINSENPLDL